MRTWHGRDELRVEVVRNPEVERQLNVKDEVRSLWPDAGADHVDRRWTADGQVSARPVRILRWWVVGQSAVDGTEVWMADLPLLLELVASWVLAVAGVVVAAERAAVAAATATATLVEPTQHRETRRRSEGRRCDHESLRDACCGSDDALRAVCRGTARETVR
jgi:hypothetical protein